MRLISLLLVFLKSSTCLNIRIIINCMDLYLTSSLDVYVKLLRPGKLGTVLCRPVAFPTNHSQNPTSIFFCIQHRFGQLYLTIYEMSPLIKRPFDRIVLSDI